MKVANVGDILPRVKIKKKIVKFGQLEESITYRFASSYSFASKYNLANKKPLTGFCKKEMNKNEQKNKEHFEQF